MEENHRMEADSDYFEGLESRINQIRSVWSETLVRDCSASAITRFGVLVQDEGQRAEAEGFPRVAELTSEIHATLLALGRDSGEFSDPIKQHISACVDQLAQTASSIVERFSQIALEAHSAVINPESRLGFQQGHHIYVFLQTRELFEQVRPLGILLRSLGFNVVEFEGWLELGRMMGLAPPLATLICIDDAFFEHNPVTEFAKNLQLHRDSLSDQAQCYLHSRQSSERVRMLAFNAGIEHLYMGPLNGIDLAARLKAHQHLLTTPPQWALVGFETDTMLLKDIRLRSFKSLECCCDSANDNSIDGSVSCGFNYDGLLICADEKDRLLDDPFGELLLMQTPQLFNLPKVVLAENPDDPAWQHMQAGNFLLLSQHYNVSALSLRLEALSFQSRYERFKERLLQDIDAVTGLSRWYPLSRCWDNDLDKTIAADSACTLVHIDNWHSMALNWTRDASYEVRRALVEILITYLEADDSVAQVEEHNYVLIHRDAIGMDFSSMKKSIERRVSDYLLQAQQSEHPITPVLHVGTSLVNGDSFAKAFVNARTVAQLAQDNPNTKKSTLSKAQLIKSATSRIKHAVESQALTLFYQPIINMKGESLERYEVLVRMVEAGGVYSPAEFIPEGAPANLARFVDRWVVTKVLAMFEELSQQRRGLMLFIKLSAETLSDQKFLPWLRKQLERSTAPFEGCVFMLKEADIARYSTESQALESLLKEWNIAICMDRVCGSELSQQVLDLLHPSYIKLDKQCLQDGIRNPKLEAQIEIIIELAQQRDINVLGSHIESTDGLSFGMQKGVSLFQGYFLQRPESAMDFDFSMTS